MIKDDSLYQVLLKHNFSLLKGNMCISDYLENHLKQYFSDVIQAKNGENKFLGIISSLCLKKKLIHFLQFVIKL